MNNKETDRTIAIQALWKMFLRRLPWLLFAMLLCGALMLGYCALLATPKYTASTTLYVYSDGTINRNESMNVTYSELYAAQYLADPYIAVLNSDTMMQLIANRLGLEQSPQSLRNAIRITTEENSLVLTISATHEDPQTAQNILLALVDEAPKEIERVIRAGGISVIDSAKLPTKPSSPNILRDTLAGALGGMLILLLVFVVIELTSSVVRNEEELQKMISVPVLGTIPKIEFHSKEERA